MSDNLRIWSQVEKTDPSHTKQVNQRGGFTAVSANYQIMRATEVFGPIGEGWGYIAGDPIFHETLLFVQVTLWHGDRKNSFGPMLGCEEWKDGKGRIDSDAGKKATTDAVTKLLSQLGFSADVFLGKYDDQKYVAEVKREFAEAAKAGSSAPTLDDAQWAELVTLIDLSGSSAVEVCRFYQIKDLRDLPAARVDGLRKNLNDMIAAKQKAAA